MGENPLPQTEAGRAGVDETMVERFKFFCDVAEKNGIKLPLTKDGIHYIYEPFINDDTLLMIFNDHHIEKINIIYDEV